jgi:hypothetical protein
VCTSVMHAVHSSTESQLLVRVKDRPRGICGRNIGTGTAFSPSPSLLPC